MSECPVLPTKQSEPLYQRADSAVQPCAMGVVIFLPGSLSTFLASDETLPLLVQGAWRDASAGGGHGREREPGREVLPPVSSGLIQVEVRPLGGKNPPPVCEVFSSMLGCFEEAPFRGISAM